MSDEAMQKAVDILTSQLAAEKQAHAEDKEALYNTAQDLIAERQAHAETERERNCLDAGMTAACKRCRQLEADRDDLQRRLGEVDDERLKLLDKLGEMEGAVEAQAEMLSVPTFCNPLQIILGDGTYLIGTYTDADKTPGLRIKDVGIPHEIGSIEPSVPEQVTPETGEVWIWFEKRESAQMLLEKAQELLALFDEPAAAIAEGQLLLSQERPQTAENNEVDCHCGRCGFRWSNPGIQGVDITCPSCNTGANS